MVEVSGNSGELPPEAASRLSARLGGPLVPFDTHWEMVQACDKLRLERDILLAERDRYKSALEEIQKGDFHWAAHYFIEVADKALGQDA